MNGEWIILKCYFYTSFLMHLALVCDRVRILCQKVIDWILGGLILGGFPNTRVVEYNYNKLRI